MNPALNPGREEGGECLGEASEGKHCGNGNRAGRREERSFLGKTTKGGGGDGLNRSMLSLA